MNQKRPASLENTPKTGQTSGKSNHPSGVAERTPFFHGWVADDLDGDPCICIFRECLRPSLRADHEHLDTQADEPRRQLEAVFLGSAPFQLADE